MKKAFITVGLGFGDEGKGTVVDFLSQKFRPDFVARYSGAHQCGHNVVQPDGRHHCFSQFGSGAFHGIQTYFGRNMIMEPLALAKEGKHLRELGVPETAFNVLINRRTLVCNPWFKGLNRIKERLNNHGSCGVGVGETRRYFLEHGNDSIFAEDLGFLSTLEDKLHLIKMRVIEECRQLGALTIEDEDWILRGEVRHIAKFMVQELKAACNPTIVDDMPLFNCVVFEGAQGTLLDENFGFHPYTTWSTTTVSQAWEEMLLTDVPSSDNTDIESIGITRSYSTRHGFGPFPAEKNEEGYRVNFPEPHNPTNDWQSNFRQGPLDLVMLQYACKVNYGLTGLFVTHLDREMPVVIKPQFCYNLEEMQKAKDKTRWLTGREPQATPITGDILDTIKNAVNLPILGESRGTTYKDKTWHG